MKKLTGMKKRFSSLENKKIKRNDLKFIQGSQSYAIESNFAAPGCYEADHYTQPGGQGGYIGRLEVC